MGTNYYLHYNEEVVGECCSCGQTIKKQKIRHLGKSSGGWHFALHVYPDEMICDFDDVLNEIKRARASGGVVKDEYNVEYTFDEFFDVVTKRSRAEKVDYSWYGSKKRFLDSNSAEEGLNNLVRARVGRHCIGHGEGTYDYFVGEFS